MTETIKAIKSGHQVLIVRGSPDNRHEDYVLSSFLPNGGCRLGRAIALANSWIMPLKRGWHYTKTKEKVEGALSAGRQARFEHGETP